ncbi:hypothetical protein [Microbacterium sp. NPDC057650]|uniref:hypothetical protein n=1 Tax=unclassified Microbacterium TaxID=2609290 RepID=UPI0036719211
MDGLQGIEFLLPAMLLVPLLLFLGLLAVFIVAARSASIDDPAAASIWLRPLDTTDCVEIDTLLAAGHEDRAVQRICELRAHTAEEAEAIIEAWIPGVPWAPGHPAESVRLPRRDQRARES